MIGIAEHELNRVLAGRQLDTSLGLARSEMKMRFVLCNRLIGIEWFAHIDEQMVMAGILIIIPRVGHAHVAKAEATPECSFDGSPIMRPYEIEQGILWRRLSLSESR